jgi:type I restriction enzyme R subunit
LTVPNEYTEVEEPFIRQLVGMGWNHLAGDMGVPALSERASFREVLLKNRLRDAMKRINLGDNGKHWIDHARIDQAVGQLDRVTGHHLMEVNKSATELLLTGASVDADPGDDAGRSRTARFIDFDHPERNDFLVINQFRVDPPWAQSDRDFIVPDVVLFVNGIPLVVIECKSPKITDPMDAAIEQLLRYTNQRDWIEADEGAERLFHYNQLLVATWFHQAKAGTIGATAEHFLEWKDTSPVLLAHVARELGVEKLRSQHTLVAGMLRPEHLLDLVRNFSVFTEAAGRKIKIVARYQQFRAVHESIRRLRKGKTKRQAGTDQRGGIIWHTQGSGKSLTMVFLVRKMRTLPDLRTFKIVVVTDRKDLEKQLADTAVLSGETPFKAKSTEKLKAKLREEGPGLVFGTIQKMQERDEDAEVIEFTPVHPEASLAAEAEVLQLPGGKFEELNASDQILLLVDEAHRSHGSTLHLNLMEALPNAAKIGFTGTPILMGAAKRTHEIFGTFIDRYTIKQSEEDGATVPILYELRTAEGGVSSDGTVDQLFDDMFGERSEKEREAIRKKYATTTHVLEAPKLIAKKADDIIRHYVDNVLPNGFKAQVVAASRLAVVRFQAGLEDAKARLLKRIDALTAAQVRLTDEALEGKDPETQFLVRAHRRRDLLASLEVAAVISGSHNDDPAWKEWSDRSKIDTRIERFKKPLVHADPAKRDPLALLCVKSMLLTGFDAPVEQVLYLDRFMQGADLLQAIARVNRTAPHKTCGLVVDYYGIGKRLREALSVYTAEDVEGVATDISDELPKLRDRHERVLAFFRTNGINDIAKVNDCVDLLRDPKLRAEFLVLLKGFLTLFELFRARPEGRPFLRDVKILGFIAQQAANLYRDEHLKLAGIGQKVRELIDEYVVAKGVNPKIPPISITDAEFLARVDGRPSKQSQASEMEHAARYHIAVHFNEDPAYYKRLSERLEQVLEGFKENWDQLNLALKDLVKTVQAGRPADETGLDPKTQAPFFNILVDECELGGGKVAPETLKKLAELTVELVDHARQEIRAVDFWKSTVAQNVLRGWVVQRLDDADVLPFERLTDVAGRLVELAKALHPRLVE